MQKATEIMLFHRLGAEELRNRLKLNGLLPRPLAQAVSPIRVTRGESAGVGS